jgi:23S rRNA (cytidine1920-2'-O)/16S rRNA (cytidine1409-2'-O)-methyltransferase
VSAAPEQPKYVSRGGLKLRHALDTFGFDVSGLTCADFGCNVGGFTDCLLHGGAAKVYAIDTGYGELAWKLRNDPRVVVMERTNALMVELPAPEERVNLVVIDMGWTPQAKAIPAALRWLKPRATEVGSATSAPQVEYAGTRALTPPGRIITLIKPHYELAADEKHLLARGVLADDVAEQIARRTADAMGGYGARLLRLTQSPIRGGKGKGRAGNLEWLALLAPAE